MFDFRIISGGSTLVSDGGAYFVKMKRRTSVSKRKTQTSRLAPLRCVSRKLIRCSCGVCRLLSVASFSVCRSLCSLYTWPPAPLWYILPKARTLSMSASRSLSIFVPDPAASCVDRGKALEEESNSLSSFFKLPSLLLTR